MSGEDLASNYSFGEYDDFSEYDVSPEHNDSDSLCGDSGAIPKSNILVLSDIEQSFVVLGRDILKSIKEFSCDDSPESSAQSTEFEVNEEAATLSVNERRVDSKILPKSEAIGFTFNNTKKPLSNLKDVTERFRSTSSPLLYDSNDASPSNEAFFNSTAKNRAVHVESATERQNKLLKEIKQILQQKAKLGLPECAQKSKQTKTRDNIDHFPTLKMRVNDVTKAMKQSEIRDPHFLAEMRLKSDREILDDQSVKLCTCANTENDSTNPIFDGREGSESLKIQELKKVIDESLRDELNVDKRSKQLLRNFKNSIEIFESSGYDSSNDNCNTTFEFSSSSGGRNKLKNLSERKGLVEKAKTLSYAVVLNYTICIVFMIFMYFCGVILLDLLKMCDKIVVTTARIDRYNAFNIMTPEFDFFVRSGKPYS